MMFQSVPVCMFHHVNEHSGDFITVSTANFEKMMTMLAHENYATLSSEQFLLYKLGIVSVPRKSVLLTFDDAWLDTYINAFPIMRRYGHQFTIFVVSDRTSASSQFERSGNPASFPKHAVAERLLDSPGIGEVVCNWKDLSDMLDSGLCSIENHTATHGKTQNLDFDIARGREEIRKVLGAGYRHHLSRASRGQHPQTLEHEDQAFHGRRQGCRLVQAPTGNILPSSVRIPILADQA